MVGATGYGQLLEEIFDLENDEYRERLIGELGDVAIE